MFKFSKITMSVNDMQDKVFWVTLFLKNNMFFMELDYCGLLKILVLHVLSFIRPKIRMVIINCKLKSSLFFQMSLIKYSLVLFVAPRIIIN